MRKSGLREVMYFMQGHTATTWQRQDSNTGLFELKEYFEIQPVQNWRATCKRMKLDYCLTPYTKVNLKWIKDLNVGHETIKLLEKKHRQKPLRHKHEQLSPEGISSGKGNKSKNEQMGLHQAKKLLYSKEHHHQSKKSSYSMGEYIFNDISDKGLTSKIYKELICLNTQQANNLIKNGSRI